MNDLDQGVGTKGFFEHGKCATRQCALQSLIDFLPGAKNDRKIEIRLLEAGMKGDAVDVGHAHVQEETIDAQFFVGGDKGGDRGEAARRKTASLEQTAYFRAAGLMIVDHGNTKSAVESEVVVGHRENRRRH